MPYTYIQSCSNFRGGSNRSLSCIFPNPVGANHVIVVYAVVGVATAGIDFSDSLGLTYNNLANGGFFGTLSLNGINGYQNLGWANTGSVSGNDTVTVSITQPDYIALVAVEYAIEIGATQDTFAHQEQIAGFTVTQNITTSNPNGVLILASVWGGATGSETLSAGSGLTSRFNSPNLSSFFGILIGDQPATTAGLYSPQASASTSGNKWGTIALALTPVLPAGVCLVTGQLQNADGSPDNDANSFVRFILRGYSGQVPRVPGQSIIAEPQIDVYPDTNGNVSTLLWGNAAIVPANTFYTIEHVRKGRVTSRANYIVTCPFNLNSAIPIPPKTI